ncbi:putative tyrosinase [Podospora aff. communis PSN243]|uniref:Tyrosinase n=1 Tax=Podospora aff. communis PSN243 TaxID=3040156 RepID=A0AAV9H0Z4_9PEZI|nr:putative tyrosinase [Podospora aff. communis PSN243]
MKTTALLSSALAATSLCHGSALPRNTSTVTDDITPSPDLTCLIDSAKTAILSHLATQTLELAKRGLTPTCTPSKLRFRREYGSLSRSERLAYIKAVKCLMALPPRTPSSVAPGARSRFDDFIVTHIQQTLSIHYSGVFQPWHRWYVYQFEKALRDECGYEGYQPYWDWPRYASAPQDSPLFDGSDTSLGGVSYPSQPLVSNPSDTNLTASQNGEYLPHPGPIIVPPPGVGGNPIPLPAGLGSGPVTTGPFANMTVNLGPASSLDTTLPGPLGGLGHNPRRLHRDLGPAMNTRYANYTTILTLLTQPNVDAYRHVSEGVPYTVEIGPHGGIHYTIGGDPGGDLFTSPGDPAFWVHHGNMDRMWTIWQALGGPGSARYTDLGSGPYAHVTWANEPSSPLASLGDVIDLGYAADSTTIGQVMSTTAGDFCYFYL